MSSGPNSPQHLPQTLSLKCQWCFRGRTQNQKCSRHLWRNSVGLKKREKNSKKPLSRQERRYNNQQPITILLLHPANGGVVTVETSWREADSVTASNTVRSRVYQGQEVTCSRSVYQNNPLYKWIIGWNAGAYRPAQPGCARRGFMVAAVGSYQRAESDDLEDWFHEEEGGEHDVEVLQDFIIRFRCTVKLEGHKKLCELRVWQTQNFPLSHLYSEVELNRVNVCTFIMRTMVLSAIRAMMLYSKGGETTNCHMRYWKLSLFFGMWRVRGLALMAKSIQALCGRERKQELYYINTRFPTFRRIPPHLVLF